MSGRFPPPVVSYYWVAALQEKTPSVLAPAFWSSIVAGATLFFPVFAVLIGVFVLDWASGEVVVAPGGATTGGRNLFFDLLLYPVIGLPIAVAIALLAGFFYFGIYALAGGYAIDRARGGRTLASLFLAILLATAIFQAIPIVVGLMVGAELGWFDYVNLFPIALAWFVALLASGFPSLLGPGIKPAPAAASATVPLGPSSP